MSSDGPSYIMDQTHPVESFLNEWSIFRRNLSTYPAEHPILEKSGDRMGRHLEALQARTGTLEMGILKEKLLVNGESWGEGNPKILRFAEELRTAGIAGLVLKTGLSWQEMAEFCRLLQFSPDEMETRGGLRTLFDQCNLPHIRLTEIDYSGLKVTEEKKVDPSRQPPQELWDDFILGLIQATVGPGGAGTSTAIQAPVALAQFLNKKLGHDQDTLLTTNPGLNQSFGQLVKRAGASVAEDPARKQLLSFIRHLHPEIRRQFLEGSLKVLDKDAGPLESIMSELPSSALKELLQAENELSPGKEPPLLKILHRLLDIRPVRLEPQNFQADSAAVEALHTMFREDSSELFAEEPYRKQLDQMMQLDQVPNLSEKETSALTEALEMEQIESKLCAVILEVAQALPPDEQADLLSCNLMDISTYFLELGDFPALTQLFDRLAADAKNSDHNLTDVITQALQTFHTDAFIQEVLGSLSLWGKPKYGEIQAIIRRIGAPAIDPLLDALATEESMSLRRYYMECLGRMGSITRPYLVARIQDERWYFIRNLVVLLRQLNDASVLPSLEGLRDHSHLRVRQEVIRLFLQFNDNRAIKFLQAEMDSTDLEDQLAAIRLAEQSKSPVILRKLLSMLSTSDLSNEGMRLQTAIVRALGEMGSPEALPELKKILSSHSLFHPMAQLRLKAEVARNLGRFPAEKVRGLLEKLSASRSSQLAEAARESLLQLKRRPT